MAAALYSKTVVKLSRQQAARAAGALVVSRRDQSNLALYKRGTGGRSSFSGVVATVFGPSGWIGRGVINKLGKIGCQVIVPYRFEPYKYRDVKLAGDLGQILFVPYNLKDEDSIYKALKYSNVVINLVERRFASRFFSIDDINHQGARRIARIAKEAGVQKFVHLSHVLAQPNPPGVYIKGGSEFVKTKWLGEEAVREEFPEAVIMRRSDIMEHHALQYGKPSRRHFCSFPVWNKGQTVIKSPVFRSDLTEGIVKVILDTESDGKVYDCVGAEEYYLCDLVEYYIKLMRRQGDSRIVHPPPTWRLKVWLVDNFYMFMKMFYPRISLELMERETLSETVSGRNPTLEDLGVKLTRVEDQGVFLFDLYRGQAYLEDKVGEVPVPPPPPTAAERDAMRRPGSAFV